MRIKDGYTLNGFPERLEELIYLRDFTISDFSKRVGRQRTIIYHWLNGYVTPDLIVFDRICEVLQTNPQWLMYGEGQRDKR